MLYKLITKFIVNKVKSILNKVVAPTECNFVLGCHIADNIVIRQEVIHSMRQRRNGKGKMVIKLDMEKKTYDCLSRNFILDTLINLSILQNLVFLIVKYISTSSMRVM